MCGEVFGMVVCEGLESAGEFCFDSACYRSMIGRRVLFKELSASRTRRSRAS